MKEVDEGSTTAVRSVSVRVGDLLTDARAARAAGDWRLARSLLDAAAVLDPGNQDVASLLGDPAARRQMTLLFCDVVGSTELADSLDPEDVSALLRLFRTTCERVITRYEGHIDDHRGDGMLVLFGYPQVNEDDAYRAVGCGLEMVRELRKAFSGTAFAAEGPVQVRIGVHTDLVLVGDVGISGSTANEASRIEAVAAPDTVVVSDTTMQLVADRFKTTSLGVHTLRGVSREVELFRVTGERDAPEHIRPGRTLTPFVGRGRELEQIVGAATASDETLLIAGPPGIGKTRLVREAARRIDLPLTMAGCSRLHQPVALHPLRACLAEALGMDEAADPAERLARIRARVPDDDAGPSDLPFLGAVFDIPLELLSSPDDVDPSVLRERALLVAAEILLSSGPRLLFVDDLHWADQSTLELLSIILRAPHPGLVLVLAARDSFEAPWPEGLTPVVTLTRLSATQTFELAEAIPGQSPLSIQRRDELIDRCDGIPLFLEELVLTEAAGGDEAPHRALRFGTYRIPPALRDPLLARLSVPGVDVELAQVASVIGRDVERNLLREALGVDEAEFDRRLETVAAAGIVELDESHIHFRHELIRELAYESQRRAAVRERHSWLADHLRSSALSRGTAEEIAFHLEHSQRTVEAVDTHLGIAQGDLAVGSHVEATRRLTLVLTLLDSVEDGPVRQTYELTVRGMRSFSSVMARGYTAPEAAEDHSRCIELSESLRPAPDVVPFLIQSWSYYALRGDLTEADRVTETASRIVERADAEFPARTMGDGVILFFRGQFPNARRLLEEFVASEWAASPGQPPVGWPLPNDPLAAAYAHLTPIRRIAGDPEGSARCEAYGSARAAELPFPHGPFSALYVDCLHAMTLNLAGDFEGAARLGQQLAGLGDRHGFVIWRLAGVLHSLVNSIQLGAHEACDQLFEMVQIWRNVLGANAWTPYWLTTMGFAQQHAGRLTESRVSFDQALDVAAQTDAGFFSAETLRGRGEVLLALGDNRGAADLAAAVELARRQGAQLFEQRAAAALAGAAGP